jgi:hypothetical protein
MGLILRYRVRGKKRGSAWTLHPQYTLAGLQAQVNKALSVHTDVEVLLENRAPHLFTPSRCDLICIAGAHVSPDKCR